MNAPKQKLVVEKPALAAFSEGWCAHRLSAFRGYEGNSLELA
jgi:hypothetical protein